MMGEIKEQFRHEYPGWQVTSSPLRKPYFDFQMMERVNVRKYDFHLKNKQNDLLKWYDYGAW